MSKVEDMKTAVEALQVRIVGLEKRVDEIAAYMRQMESHVDHLRIAELERSEAGAGKAGKKPSRGRSEEHESD